MTGDTQFDVILAGGGLANCLIAYRLRQRHPAMRIAIVERGARLGGNHTWSFHTADLTPAQLDWTAPLVAYSWPRQEVRFPGFSRVLETGYNSVTSEQLSDIVGSIIGAGVVCNGDIAALDAQSVTLADQRVLYAPCVIDGRGVLQDSPLALGYQKFIGLEVEIAGGHGQEHPIIMDATVPQTDGYRFIYTLPFTPTRILIEDTYYADGAELGLPALRDQIADYAQARGWRIEKVLREEVGVLPIVLAGDIDQFWREAGGEVARSGLRACLFHPVTGYSFPDAVRLADLVADAAPLASRTLASSIEQHSRGLWRDRAYLRFLNRLLFIAAEPVERVAVMARFYRLPQPLIKRFYAAQLTMLDRGRIVFGKPLVPLGKAIACLDEAKGWQFAARNGGPGPAI